MKAPSRVVASAVVGAAAFATQVPAIGGSLLWDDVLVLRRTSLYVDPARLAEALSVPLGRETFYWRPLATTSFLAETLLHGGSDAGYRATSALLFAVAAAAGAWLAASFLRNGWAGLLVGALWALHPVHVETATWVSARFDLLSALFAFVACAAAGDGLRPGPARLAAVGLATAASALSKEAGYTLPLVVPLVAAAWGAAPGDGPPRPGLRETLQVRKGVALAAAAALGIVLFVRSEVVGYVVGLRPSSVEGVGGPLSHALLVGRAYATYFESLLLPWTVGPAHTGPRPVPADDLRGWIGIVLLAATVAATAWTLRRRPRTGFLLAAFLVSLAPVVQILPLDLAGGVDAADRYLFRPSLFAVLAVADLVAGAAAARAGLARSLAAGAALASLAFAAARVDLLARWKDPVSFWSFAAEMGPKTPLFRAQLAGALLDAGRADEAEAAARSASLEMPDVYADVLLRRGRPEEAAEVLDQALRLDSQNVRARLLRGEVRLLLDDPVGAVEDFDLLIAYESEADRGRFARVLPTALAGRGEAGARIPERRNKAETWIRRAEAAATPDDARAWAAIERAWLALDRRADAARARAMAEGRPSDGR